MSDADKLVDLVSQLFPPPQPKIRCVLRMHYDPPMPAPAPGENVFEIVLVPLVAPECPAVVGQRTNGEGERFY